MAQMPIITGIALFPAHEQCLRDLFSSVSNQRCHRKYLGETAQVLVLTTYIEPHFYFLICLLFMIFVARWAAFKISGSHNMYKVEQSSLQDVLKPVIPRLCWEHYQMASFEQWSTVIF